MTFNALGSTALDVQDHSNTGLKANPLMGKLRQIRDRTMRFMQIPPEVLP